MGATPAQVRALDFEGLLRRSVEVIRENQDASGAYVASPSLPTYRFSWLRDGAFIADAMSRAGDAESADAFFRWCGDVLVARAERVAELIARHRAGDAVGREEHLHCRYRLDGREHDAEWSNFQLDGYGLWLWALGEHAARHSASLERYRDGAAVSVRYVAEFWREPCFDWWEERWGTHTATLASAYAGLAAASTLESLPDDARSAADEVVDEVAAAIRAEAVADGRLGAELGDARLDASLVACATPLGVLAPDDPLVASTVRALEDRIAHGGVHRYPGDTYYGGGEWLLLAALLGWHYARVGRTGDAWAQLEWVAAQAAPNGDLPEQVETHLESPDAYDEWLGRWGASASPLLWSHAMYITLALELGVPNE